MSRTGKLAAAGLATVLSLVLAAPASAIKLKYVQEANVAGADAVTTVAASCPNGFNVVGGGAFASGAYNEMKIQSSFPADGGDDDNKPDDAWFVTAWNTAPMPRSTESQAICSKAKPKYREETWTVGIAAPPQVKCPNGTKPSGGGIATAGTFPLPVNLLSTRPSDGLDENSKPDAWFANAQPPGMQTPNATTHAICVKPGDFKPRYYTESMTADNGEQDVGAEVCGTGERVVGLGGATNSNDSAIVTLFGLDTTDNDLKLDDGTNLVVDNYSAGDIFPEAYSVCAK